MTQHPQPSAEAPDGCLPPLPDCIGWHWLRRHTDGALCPWLWTDEGAAPGEFGWHDEESDGSPTTFARWFSYYAPCDPPALAALAAPGEVACSDCPPAGYPTDTTRCLPCPQRATAAPGGGGTGDGLIGRLASASYGFAAHVDRDGTGWVKVRQSDLSAAVERLRATPAPGGGGDDYDWFWEAAEAVYGAYDAAPEGEGVGGAEYIAKLAARNVLQHKMLAPEAVAKAVKEGNGYGGPARYVLVTPAELATLRAHPPGGAQSGGDEAAAARVIDTLPSLVKARRGAATLRDTAAQIGIRHSTLYRVEGGAPPDMATFVMLCRWLATPPADAEVQR